MASARNSKVTGSDAPEVPQGAGQVILVVDDDPSLRRMVIAQLRSLGYRALGAENVQAALEYLETETEIDLLLTDIVLSGDFNGVDLGNIARDLRSTLKVIYMSGYPASAPEAGTPLKLGAPLLRKPFRRNELAIAMEKSLNNR